MKPRSQTSGRWYLARRQRSSGAWNPKPFGAFDAAIERDHVNTFDET